MSNQIKDAAASSSLDCPVVEGRRQVQHVPARAAEVGGIPIHRVLPSRQRRLVGAWCFLDHAGPAVFKGDSRGMQVGPHPHIGLQTFTWMIAGEVLHRDSLGSEQVIRPGQVNLMTAGRGISHTEQSLPEDPQLHAAQLWIALPHAHRDSAPRFDHYPALPTWQEEGVTLTLLVGELAGREAPTLTFSPLVGVDLAAEREATLTLPLRPEFEYALLPLEGAPSLEGEALAVDELAYLGRGRNEIELALPAGARVLLIGGEPLGEEVLIWWNFVGHSKAEIAEAQREWEAGSERFGRVAGFSDEERLMPPPLPWKGEAAHAECYDRVLISSAGPSASVEEVMGNRQETMQLLQRHFPEMVREFGVHDLALFGSVARDEAGTSSDVDILVSFDGPATADRYFGLQFFLEDLLGRPVDLVTDKALRPELRPYIEREAMHV